MAYGRKYYKEFDGYNAVTKTVYSVLVDIYQDGYVGAATEIEKITASPLQLSLDSSGDPLYTPIKKTSASFNIIDTGQFDYSEFYTSNAKKYKMMITSPVFNWTGYLVPQAVSFDLATNGEFSLTASDGLHLLSTIDYVADPDAILTLSDFITDIETKIGLSTFDRSTTINTEYGDIWTSLIYQGMFTDKTYEEALEMVLKAIGMQVRYWKMLPVISVESALQTTTVKCTNDFPELNFLAPIKNAKVTQKITTLPNALSGALVDDAKDLMVRTGGYYTLKNWVPASDNGVICSIGQMYTGRFQDNKYTDIHVFTNPTNYTYTGSPTPPLSAGSYYKLRKVKSTALSLTFSANFGRIGTYTKFDDGYTTNICPVKWSSIRWGLYDETTDRSFNILTGFWDIVGTPTRTNSNELKAPNPADSYTDRLVEVAYLSSFTESLRFYLFQGQVEYDDFSGDYDDRKLPVLSIKSIKLDGEDVIQENELYTSVTGNVAVGENIDVLDYEVEFSDAPTPQLNTSLYYGSAFFDNQLNQLLTVIIGASSVSFMQYIFNSILYTQNEIRKKVYTANVVMQSNVSPFWLKTTLKDDTVMVNSCTFDFKTSQLNAELTEIMPYVYREWSIISDSEIGSSEWGGSGGQAGTIGGSTPTIDTSNFVVKTGATAQTIEGNITVNNLYSKGGVVAKTLLPTDATEWPQAGTGVDGVIKYDGTTLGRNAQGQLAVIGGLGTSVAWGTEVANQSVQLIVAAITKTLSLSTHTHSNYLTAITKSMVETVLTGEITTHTHALDADLTAIAALTGTIGLLKKTALNTWELVTTYTADTLTTPRAINISVSGIEGTAQNFDGSAPITIPVTLKTLTRGTYLTGDNYNGGADTTWAVDATSTNTASKVVARDANGDFSMRDLSLRNGYAEGALVAKYLSSTYSQDWPIAGSSVYGTIKYDPATLSLNGSGQLTVIGGGWSNVAWGTVTGQYAQLTVDSVTRNLSVDGHTHSYLPLSGGVITGNTAIITGYIECGIRFGGLSDNGDFVGRYNNYVSLYNHLNSGQEIRIPDSGAVTIGGNFVWHSGNSDNPTTPWTVRTLTSYGSVVANASEGFQNNVYVGGYNPIWSFSTAKNFGIGYYQSSIDLLGFGLDGIGFHFGNTSLPPFFVLQNGEIHSSSLTLTGAITGATTGSFSTSVISPSFIGNASTATKLNSVRTFALTGDVAGTITSDLASGVSISTVIQPNSVALGTDTTGNYAGSVLVSGNGLSITGVAGEGTAFTVISNATSLNTASTIMFRDSNGDYHARNGLHDGSVVAKYLSSTFATDWPVMTASVLGVAKASGLAVYPTAGDLALRVKHYTTTTTNSWQNKAYSISMDIPITSPASLAANSYHSSTFLYALPTSKCLACQVTVIPYATGGSPAWIGMQLIASVAKDSTGCWRVFVYNPTSSAVDLTNVRLSIIAQMIE